MNVDLKTQLQEYEGDIVMQCAMAGIDEDCLKDFILREMNNCLNSENWDSRNLLIGMARSARSKDQRAEIFNELLIMQGHDFHQEVTMGIQRTQSPSSVPYIRQVLERGFEHLAYTGSEDSVIAKWFSHALAAIGTPEAVAVIREYAQSSDEGISSEMKYRLERLNA